MLLSSSSGYSTYPTLPFSHTHQGWGSWGAAGGQVGGGPVSTATRTMEAKSLPLPRRHRAPAEPGFESRAKQVSISSGPLSPLPGTLVLTGSPGPGLSGLPLPSCSRPQTSPLQGPPCSRPHLERNSVIHSSNRSQDPVSAFICH